MAGLSSRPSAARTLRRAVFVLLLSSLAASALAGSQAGAPGAVAERAAAANANPVNPVTIDSMLAQPFGGYSETYTPSGGLMLIGGAERYYLSDGGSFYSGAGYAPKYYCRVNQVIRSGDSLRYVLSPPADSVLYYGVDWGDGTHSSQATLVAAGPIVIRAKVGTGLGTIEGFLRVRDNVCLWYGESRFNYFGAKPGRVVPFRTTYSLNRPWSEAVLDSSFTYQMRTMVDFTRPLPPSPLLSLEVSGPLVVRMNVPTAYRAIARYGGDYREDVTDSAAWVMLAPPGASVDRGVVTLGAAGGQGTGLEVRAAFATSTADSVSAGRTAYAYDDRRGDRSDQWPMYQADAAHTGYRPMTLDPGQFSTRWVRAVAPVTPNPITAADGMVFWSLRLWGPYSSNSLFVLDAGTGNLRWATAFPRAQTLNPPGYLDGNVYVQTTRGERETYLHAFRAADGSLAFRVPHSAQAEHYYAPTFFEHTLYTNGGYGGGMYAFDAFSGVTEYFAGSLPQYDEWTPAVDSTRAFAYLGSTDAGLFVLDRSNGAVEFRIPDPGFSSYVNSMNLAPVLGGHDDVLVIQAGRLLSFDLGARSIRWSSARAFKGQPSVAAGVIYAIDGARLVALEQDTGTELWSWSPPAGSLLGQLVVTDSHVLVATASVTYAIDLATRASEWSYPGGGSLALANGCLYVLSSAGTLVAITLSDQPTGVLVRRFDAEWEACGIALRWDVAPDANLERTTIARAASLDGEWTPLVELDAQAPGEHAWLDRAAERGNGYWYRLELARADDSPAIVGPVHVAADGAASATSLLSLGPMPAMHDLEVKWVQANAGRVRVQLLDVQGRVAASVFDEVAGAGTHAVRWPLPSGLPPGVFVLRFDVGPRVETRRLVVIR